MSDYQLMYDVSEDVMLRDLGSLSPEPSFSPTRLNEDVTSMKETIRKQNLEIEALRKQVQEHEHYVTLMKLRSVQCLSAMTKFKTGYMQEEAKAVLKLDDLLDLVNKVLPAHMKALDRTELLSCSRELGLTWRKSNGTYVCDGWSIRKPKVVSIKEPTVSPMSSPGSPSGLSPAPIYNSSVNMPMPGFALKQ